MRLRAPAKLTWTLEVTGQRPDGFHLLRSEMCSLDFADELDLDEQGDFLVVEGGGTDVPAGSENLVARALHFVNRRAGVRLTKVIPSGGGLGGGSADAAAILRWARWREPRDAVTLGGDVPFCLVGGRALVEGVGEIVTPLEFEERTVTLLLTNFVIPTPRVYQAFDEGWRSAKSSGNDLEVAARAVEPRLGRVLDWARARYDDVRLAGSGSTIFVVGDVSGDRDVKSPDGPLRWVRSHTTPPEGR
ncbi:MAG: 4-(cytidine 5'-diphospho)-2-C-methyl-D-erythritol kinase [Acidimicrobiaceae bacterium]|nr:4-(cytidine 5'-diphospho)-2-C-methyl-D-erythritol kinase [Acidimicrobiaceae bacterium]